MDKKRLVVISGNGLSIACSEEFAPSNLKAKLKAELNRSDTLGPPAPEPPVVEVASAKDPEADGRQTVADDSPGLKAALALAHYLDGTFGTSTDDLGFEQIVGAFDSLSRSVELLKELKAAKAAVAEAWDDEHLDAVQRYFGTLYRCGTAAALKAIDAAARRATGVSPVTALVDLVKTEFGDDVTYATLNYDTLLIGALLDKYVSGSEATADTKRKFCDLASTQDGPNVGGRGSLKLRSTSTAYATHQVTRLLNLHGSLQFWEVPDGRSCAQLKIKVGRNERRTWFDSFGSAFAEGTREVERPLVIFGNQRDKSVLVNQSPFKVAYDRLTRDLDEARAVLVIGYSFADEALNQTIREHVTWNQDIRAVLVVTKGSDPTDAAVDSVFGACGVSPVILRCGADMDKVARTWEWNRFVEIARPQDLTA